MSSQANIDPYQPENVPLFEALYGKNLISLGGTAAIENMFLDISLDNLKALDIGFGIGGVAYYLAEKYHMTISGVEIPTWMAKHAQSHAPKNIANQLHFASYDKNGNIPFSKNDFDIVYSKGVLNHVKDKAPLFKKIFSQLKNNGLFVIADWIYPNPTNKTNSVLVFETKESYQLTLQEAGFTDITFRNDSDSFVIYVKAFLENLENERNFIEKNYGEEIFTYIKNDHESLINNIVEKNKIATRIVCLADT